jgi:hypothetical protein
MDALSIDEQDPALSSRQRAAVVDLGPDRDAARRGIPSEGPDSGVAA